MSTTKVRLQSCILALDLHYLEVKGNATKAINDGSIHDSFFSKYITEIKVNEEINRLIGFDKEYVESEEYEATSDAIIVKTITNLVKRLESRHRDILFTAPSESNFIEMYALQRSLHWMKDVLRDH